MPVATLTRASTKVLGVVDVALRLDPVQKQTRAMMLQAVLWTVLEVLIGAAFVILFTRRFVATPIRQLIEGTKTVSAMELDRPIRITRRSQELNELVDSFNLMRERLKVAIDKQNEMQQTLESKVEERTQQLRTAQKKLVQSDRLASLGQLAASVAHEINNPVSGVLNLSMLLERLMANGDVPAGPRSGVPQIPWPDFVRERARRTDRLRPAGILAAHQTPSRPCGSEQAGPRHGRFGRTQTRADQCRSRPGSCRTTCRWSNATLRRSNRWS